MLADAHETYYTLNMDKGKNNLTKRQLQAIETKSRLVDTALALFKESDYDQVTIAEIAEAANISVGNFYNYFSSKHDLIMYHYSYFDVILENELAGVKFNNNLDAVRELIARQVGGAYKQGANIMAQSLRVQLITHGKYVVEDTRYFHRYLKALIARSIEAGELKESVDVDELSSMVLRISRGVIFDWSLREGNYNPVDIVLHDLNILFSSYVK